MGFLKYNLLQASLTTLGCQVYEILRPKFQVVAEIMQQIPNISAGDLQKLDEKIAMGGTKGNKIDKAKRDLFKKITGQVGGQMVEWEVYFIYCVSVSFQLIGKSVGQLFRKEVVIEDLPPIARNPNQNRHSIANLLGRPEDAGIANMFSVPNNGS